MVTVTVLPVQLYSYTPFAFDIPQTHPFFRHINWEDLLARKVEPPFKPFLVSIRGAEHKDVRLEV